MDGTAIPPKRQRGAGLGALRLCLAVTLLGLAGVPDAPLGRTADAQEVERIAAVVNQDVISTSAVTARLGLALLSSGLPATDENRDRLRPQVLRALINEALQRQEAERFDITAPEPEVQEAVETIARNNGVAPDVLMGALDQAGVPRQTLYDQIRTTLAWRNLVRARLAPQVDITEEEIDAHIDQLSRAVGLTEYLLAEIFLEIDRPADAGEVMALAEQLASEIRGGAPFPAVARQFSQSTSAAIGGDLGWVTEGQLALEIDQALGDLQPGQLSPAIVGPGGVYLVLMRDRRVVTAGDPNQAEVEVASLTVQLPPGANQATADRMMAEMRTLQDTVRGCEQFEAAAETITGGRGVERSAGRVSDLADALATRVGGAPVGEPTGWQPLPTNDGATLHMVCSREGQSVAELDREQIRQSIGEERLQRLARRYLRDLRNAAYVELRG